MNRNTDTTIRPDDTETATRPEITDSTTGPEHADTTRLEHADAAARPDHADATARPEHADTTARPRHTDTGTEPVQLFKEDETQGYRSRWEGIQAQFVDSPRESVEQADQLVAEITQRLNDLFSEERSGLEEQWSRGDGQASTEDLRMALTRYRAFFQRLLAA